MWLKSICKKYTFSVLVGIYVAAVLWITLISRVGTGYRAILFSLHSYIDAFSGDWRSFEEIIENIILFIPFDMLLGAVKSWKWKRVLVIGLCASGVIELFQIIFALGTFEFDDLMHNTFGAVIGDWIIKKIGFRTEIKRKQLIVLIIALCMSAISPIAMQSAQYKYMIKLASRYDRENGEENLLVLNGKSGYAWDTNVFIKFLLDGSIRIKGTSDKASWWPIADIELDSGEYVGRCIDNVLCDLIEIELAYWDDNEKQYKLLVEDIGEITNTKFELSQNTKIRVFVRVYSGCFCDEIVRPLIYRGASDR